MAKAIISVDLVFPDGSKQTVDNIVHGDVDYNVSQAELQQVYKDQLKGLVKEAKADGVAILEIGEKMFPITLANFPQLEVRVITLSKE